ncbi:MAG: hypothetical protein OXG24_03620 [Gammaproteobacteria bacterium]|nr:hypothetical protein [Gammaproteobacteria bacterium]
MKEQSKKHDKGKTERKKGLKRMEYERIDELVHKAPRFEQLASVIKSPGGEVSETQKKLLKEFADELAKGLEKT